MLKIALCDDDAVFLKELTGKIQELLRFEEKNAAIASFVNPTALTASVASGDRFDIFILDVEMPQIDGFKVAADLRKYQPNVALIFLTSHLQYAPEGYKVDALRFISKLNVDETLPEALQKALHTLEQQDQHSLLVQHYKNFSRVLYQNIIYVRKTARSVQIITSNQGVIKDNRGIKELFDILNDPRFIFVDRSYFVNLDILIARCVKNIVKLVQVVKYAILAKQFCRLFARQRLICFIVFEAKHRKSSFFAHACSSLHIGKFNFPRFFFLLKKQIQHTRTESFSPPVPFKSINF